MFWYPEINKESVFIEFNAIIKGIINESNQVYIVLIDKSKFNREPFINRKWKNPL